MTMDRYDQQQERGFVLLTVLMVITVTATVSTIGLSRTATDLLVTNRSAALSRAFYLAEAGIDQVVKDYTDGLGVSALAELRNDRIGDEDGLCEAAESCAHSRPELSGVILSWTPSATNPRQIVVASKGRGGLEATRTVSVQLLLPSMTVRDTDAVFGASYVLVGHLGGAYGAVVIDSYNSRLGAYGATLSSPDPVYGTTNQSQVGVPSTYRVRVATNGQPNGGGSQDLGLYIRARSEIFGLPVISNRMHRNATVDIESTAVYGGTTPTVRDPITLPAVNVPAELTSSCRSDALVVQATDTVTLTGDNCYHDVFVSQNGTLILRPGARLYQRSAGGWLSITNSGKIVAEGDNLVFADGSFYVDSRNGFINTTRTPTALQIRAVGHQDGNLLAQTERFYGLMYIQKKLWVHGHWDNAARTWTEAHYHGALISGAQLEIGNSGGQPVYVHFDEALNGTSINGEQFRLQLWQGH